MAFTWDIDCLIKGKSNVERLYENEKDESEKDYYKLILKHINDFIKTQYKDDKFKKLTINKRLEEIAEEIRDYQVYYELATNLMCIVHERRDTFSVIEARLTKVMGKKNYIEVITGASVSHEQALNLTHDFYKGFSSQLYPMFKKAFDQRYSSVQFSKTISKNVDATSTYFDVINKYYINALDSTNTSIVYSIIHEYGHILSQIINPKTILLDHDFMFDEVQSIFPEMIAKYENIGGFDRIQSLFELYGDFLNYTNMANTLVHHIPIINIWLDYQKQAKWKFYKDIKKDFGISKKDLEKEFLAANIETDGVYTTSFLVAVELYHIYKQNREKALKLYNEILHIPYNGSILNFVNNNMKLTEHLGEETNDLLEQFSLELKKKGI